jgi:hypothetical protein
VISVVDCELKPKKRRATMSKVMKPAQKMKPQPAR